MRASTYPCNWRVENAKPAAPHSVNVLFSCPDSAPDSGCRSASIGRLAGDRDREAWCCTGLQFSTPAGRPAQKPGFTIHSWS